MIEPKHISNIQISFVDVSSKEGDEFLPGDIEVQYSEGEKRITQTISASNYMFSACMSYFLETLSDTINDKNAS